MKKISILLSIALLIVACAKEESTPYADLEQQVLDAWMQKYRAGDGFTRHENGLYSRPLRHSEDTAMARPGDWIEIRFNGYALPDLPVDPVGAMFVTRDSALAAQYGTATIKTHYAPIKTHLGVSSNTVVTRAMYDVIRMMHPGEKYEFYAPSSIAYGASGTTLYTYGDWGYQGQKMLPANVPSRMEIELVRIVGQDAQADENRQVKEFAMSRLGLAEADTIKANLYLKYTPMDPLADTVRLDTTCSIYYVGMFLDGFIFDTNIDSIAQRVWGDNSKHDSLDYIAVSGGLIEAFRQAVDTMTYDSWGEMVFNSDYGYGFGSTPTVGQGGGTVFDPYTPLYFKFYILPKRE